MVGVGCLKMNYTLAKMIDMNLQMLCILKCSQFEVLNLGDWWSIGCPLQRFSTPANLPLTHKSTVAHPLLFWLERLASFALYVLCDALPLEPRDGKIVIVYRRHVTQACTSTPRWSPRQRSSRSSNCEIVVFVNFYRSLSYWNAMALRTRSELQNISLFSNTFSVLLVTQLHAHLLTEWQTQIRCLHIHEYQSQKLMKQVSRGFNY